MADEFADPEAALIGHLAGRIKAIKFMTDLPAKLETAVPVCQITRIGGGMPDPFRDSARIDFDCYARDREGAFNAAFDVRAILRALPGVMHEKTTLFTRIAEEVGPSWRPDPNPQVRRAGMTYVIGVRLQKERK